MGELALRRLAEQAIAAGSVAPMLHPQAILALLDERDALLRDKQDSVSRVNDWIDRSQAAERRVAALEEGLEPAIAAAYCKVKHGNTHPSGCGSYYGQAIAHEARALLAAAPDHQHTWQWVQTGPESGGRVCSECGHPETLSEAAAPSEPPTRCEHLDERGRRCIVVGQHQRAAGVIHTYQADPLILEGDPAALPAEDEPTRVELLRRGRRGER